MLHVNKGGGAAQLLGLGHDVLAEGGLARGLWPVDFDHTSARNAADAEGDIQGQGTGGNDFGDHAVGFAQAHDRTVAVAFEDVAYGFVEYGLFGAVNIGGLLLFVTGSGGRFSSHGGFSKYKGKGRFEFSEYSTDVQCVKRIFRGSDRRTFCHRFHGSFDKLRTGFHGLKKSVLAMKKDYCTAKSAKKNLLKISVLSVCSVVKKDYGVGVPVGWGVAVSGRNSSVGAGGVPTVNPFSP